MKKIGCVLLMMLALSCAKKDVAIPTINLAEGAIADINPDFLLNEIVESVTYKQLETKDSLFHAELSLKSINDNGDYCFVDTRKNEELSIFDKEGKLVANFNRIGHGEGEFLTPNSMFYDGDNLIEVLSERNNFLYRYNREGKYLSKINVTGAYAMTSLGNGKYLSLMYAEKEKGIVDCVRIYDSEGNVCDGFLPIDTTQTDGMSMASDNLSRSKNGYNLLINTIQRGSYFCTYNMNDNTISPICLFDTGAYGLTPNALQNGALPYQFILPFIARKMGNYIVIIHSNRGSYCTDLWNLSTGKLIARRSQDAKSKGDLQYKLPNGKMIGVYFEGYSHNDEIVLTAPAASFSGETSEPIDSEGNDVIVTLKFKQ